LTAISGEIYVGEWKDNIQHGYGTVTYANGVVFEGEWKDAKKMGMVHLDLQMGVFS
jgi:hypothetical protein